jgi:hypothetical protein
MSGVITGTAGNDTISEAGVSSGVTGGVPSADSDEIILGGDGDDSIVGGGGADQLQGDTGNDTLVAGTGDDQLLIGLDDADSLQGGSGLNQRLLGQVGDDTLVAGVGDSQRLEAGTGDDSLQGSSGTGQTLLGGSGVDILVAGGGAGQRLDGGANDDSLVGSSVAETLLGGTGVDAISGGAGNDWMDFGLGNETFTRGASESGNDTLLGGVGESDRLDFAGDYSLLGQEAGFSIYADGSDTVWAQDWETVVCFAEGTRIVTPNGEDAVENLRAGDMVLAMRDGQAGFEPLRWVGFMDVAVPRNAAMAAKTAPILIKAGAIAPGMPARDLRVSPDHAMEIDGHLIPAKHLVNGSSIIQETWCRRVRYFHLELEAHGLLLSEGTWSESYLDDGNRHAFNNAAMTGLFLDFEAGRSAGQYDQQACLPVLRQGLKLDEIHGRLLRRATELAREEKTRRLA